MNKGVGCLLILLVMALIGSVCVNVLQLTSTTLTSSELGVSDKVQAPAKFTHVLVAGSKSSSETERIVQINIHGMITGAEVSGPFSAPGFSVSTIKRALRQAVADPKVKAIVLNVNTPGGEVTASDTLYGEVKKAAAAKPVVVYMDAMATSGGYYLSAGASKIVANPTTLTGSIGVIIQTLNYSEAFGKLGLESMTFVSGAFKDSLNGARPMRDEEKAYIQSLVGQMYDRFVSVIEEGRKIPAQTLKTGVADGRILGAADALKHKLIDQVGYVEDAYSLARELSSSPNAAVVQYRTASGFWDMFGQMAESQSKDIKVEIPNLPAMQLQPGQLYLLPSHLAR